MKKVNWDTYITEYYRSFLGDISEKTISRHTRWYASWISRIRKELNISFRNKRIFEIGSGYGGILMLLQKEGALIEGSDISKELVKKMRTIRPGLPYRYSDIQRQQHTGNAYDFVFAFEVLEHLQKPKNALHNIYGLLKKGGWFIGSSPYPYDKNMKDPTHCNVKYPQEWKHIIQRSGYRSVRLLPASFPPFLWRIHPALNIVLPFYTPLPGIVSTTLILAQK